MRWTLWRQVGGVIPEKWKRFSDRDHAQTKPPDENAAAYGEVVWSWRRDPGATLAETNVSADNGGKKGRFPGESAYKP
jgi:hypothetical protein